MNFFDCKVPATTPASNQSLCDLEQTTNNRSSSPQIGTWEAKGVAKGYGEFANTPPYRSANLHLAKMAQANGINFLGRNIVEVGSGTGTGTEVIRELIGDNGSIICIDFSAQMTRFAAEKWKGKAANIRFIQADVKDLKTLDLGSPSDFFCLNAITLFPNLPLVLKDIYERLPPGGIFAVNNTLIQDAIDCDNPGKSILFFRNVMKEVKQIGIKRDKSIQRLGFPSSTEIQDYFQRSGFIIRSSSLDVFTLSKSDLLSYASVPGVFHELVGPEINQEERLRIFAQALSNLDENSTFPRRWLSLIAQKPF